MSIAARGLTAVGRIKLCLVRGIDVDLKEIRLRIAAVAALFSSLAFAAKLGNKSHILPARDSRRTPNVSENVVRAGLNWQFGCTDCGVVSR